jgi:sortase (surface protein transpeptidase)
VAAARTGILGGVTGRISALVLALLAVGVLVALVTSGGGDAGPRNQSLPPNERVAVPVPMPDAQITGIDIPRLGLHTDDTTALGLRDSSLDVPTQASTVGWYERSASPGTVGPAVLAAHVNYHGEQGAFARLCELGPGDIVEVHRDDDTTAVFVVDRVGQYSKDAFPTEAVYAPTPDSEIRMITCGGVFNEHTRSYEDNIVVFGHLVEGYRPA